MAEIFFQTSDILQRQHCAKLEFLNYVVKLDCFLQWFASLTVFVKEILFAKIESLLVALCFLTLSRGECSKLCSTTWSIQDCYYTILALHAKVSILSLHCTILGLFKVQAHTDHNYTYVYC